jgi:hypothetical protein
MPHCNVVEILENLWRRSGNKSTRHACVRIRDRIKNHGPSLGSDGAEGAAPFAPFDQKKPSFFGL